ncbi:MAG: tetratricopeptide repeat protein [Candidatus Helarchaeota archaeon]|nr:tetratricopeptide repeat protein [Candidatus Helarchaeota archaeon]
MSNLPNQDPQEQIRELISRAEKEEDTNSWNAAIEFLKEAEKKVLDTKNKELKGEIYYKLGLNYYLAGECAKSKEKVLKSYQMGIENWEIAKKIFEELKIEERVKVISGFIDFFTYLYGFGVEREINLLESAKNHFKQAKILYQQQEKFLDSTKMEIMEIKTLSQLVGERVVRHDESADFEKMVAEFDGLVVNLIDRLKKTPQIPDHYLQRFLSCMGYCFHWMGTYLSTDILDVRERLLDFFNKHKQIIDIIDNSELYSKYSESVFYAYTIYGTFSLIIGAYFADDQFEMKILFQNAKKWHKKAEKFRDKVQFNTSLSTFYVLQFSVSIAFVKLGYASADIKHIGELLTNAIESLSLFHPKSMAAHTILSASLGFAIGALDETNIKLTRLRSADRILNILEWGKNEIPMLTDPNYKLYNFFRDTELCTAYAIMGELAEDKNERTKYVQQALKLFDQIMEFSKQKPISNQSFYFYYFFISSAAIILAKLLPEIAEKRKYYEIAIDLIEKAIRLPFNFHRDEIVFMLGKAYHELGILLNDSKVLKKSYLAYMNAIEFCKNKGFYSLVGSGYVNLAQLEDRLGNFLSAAENYQKAISSFDRALLMFTYTKLGTKLEKTKNYLNAWKLIEIAKSYHAQEDHGNARVNYQQASTILQKIRDYRFESTFYVAWSELEKAEELSKGSKHQEAAKAYNTSRTLFQEAIDNFNKYMKKKLPPEDIERISKLIKVAKIRDQYCTARQQIETARLESIKGNHLLSAELYNKAGFMFENLCDVYKIKKEKDELSAICHLCKAWEYMARAEMEQESSLYATASKLFEKASHIFTKSRMKKLSLGNSLYCSALESGGLFDKTSDFDEKLNYYKKIKMTLRESAKNYQLGGFVQDAQWALATSTVFDGIWQLIQVDTEMDFSKKNQYLSMAKKYLDNALQIFEEAGYEQKKGEISKYLEMIDAEKAILTSALDVIEKPAISESSIGIVAPSCPIEISSSLSIDEMAKSDMQAASEQNWFKRIHHLYLFVPGGLCIYDYSFKSQATDEKSISASLVTGGLEGISHMIQELTKKETKLRILEQEDITILLEQGKNVTCALITEENLATLRTKLKQFVGEFEENFQTELEKFDGNINIFSDVSKFVQEIFEP